MPGNNLIGKTDVFEFRSGHDASAKFGQRNPDRLANERNGPGSSRVDLNQKKFAILDRKLNVHQTNHFKSLGQVVRSLTNFVDHFLWQIVRRKNHGGITTMHACKLDMLKHSSDNGRLAVGNTIHVQLNGFFKKFVEQHRFARSNGEGFFNYGLKFILVVHDKHSPTPENKGWTKKDRVTNTGCSFLGVLGQKGCFVLRLLEVQFVQDLLEFLTVFGQINAFGRSADDFHACFLEPGGKIERSLPTILNDCPVALFLVVDFKDVLEGERFEIQSVRGVVISGDGFGVGVDHHGLEAGLAQREGGMNAAIIEFNALPYAVGPATENHDLLGIGLLKFVLFSVGRVVVRSISLELRGTGVNQPENSMDPQSLTTLANFGRLAFPQVSQLAIGKARLLGFAKGFRVAIRQASGFDSLGNLMNLSELSGEP